MSEPVLPEPRGSKLNISADGLFAVGVVTLLISVTVAWVTTTEAIREVVTYVRLVSAFLTVSLALASLVHLGKIKRNVLLALIAFTVLFLYGIFLSENRAGVGVSTGFLTLNYGVTALTIYLVSQKRAPVFSRAVMATFAAFCGVCFAFTFAQGGFILAAPPYFVFDYLSAVQGKTSDVLYSQGASKFFGLASISTTYLIITGKAGRPRLVAACFTMLFLALCILGGARGDTAAALAVNIFMLLFRARKYLVWFGLFVLVAVLLLPITAYENIVLFDRSGTISIALIQRAEIFLDVFALIAKEPICLLTGCGFNYFQSFYGQKFGHYPHNILLEMLITFGAPITISLHWFALVGFFRYARSRPMLDDAILPIFMYFAIIGLKSGSLISAWFYLAALFYFGFYKTEPDLTFNSRARRI